MLYSYRFTTYFDITREEDLETTEIEEEIEDPRDCWMIHHRFNPIPQCDLSHLWSPFWKTSHGPKHGAVRAVETEALDGYHRSRAVQDGTATIVLLAKVDRRQGTETGTGEGCGRGGRKEVVDGREE